MATSARVLLLFATMASMACDVLASASVTRLDGNIVVSTPGKVIAFTGPNGSVSVRGTNIFRAVAELSCRTQTLIAKASQSTEKVPDDTHISAVCLKLDDRSQSSSSCGERGIGLCSMESGDFFSLSSSGNITFDIGFNGTIHAGSVDILGSIHEAEKILQRRWPALSDQQWESVLPAGNVDNNSNNLSAETRHISAPHHIFRDARGNTHIHSTGNISFTNAAGPRLPVHFVINNVNIVSALNHIMSVLNALSTHCAGSLNRGLDCGSTESRAAVRQSQPCQVQSVGACCCKEFFGLRRVQGNVNTAGSESTLLFGNITYIGGIIIGRTSLRSVDFGGVTHAGGIDLKLNKITTINFNSLLTVRRYILIYYNQLRTLNLGKLQSTGDNIDAGINSITSVDLGNLTSVGGKLELHSNRFQHIDLKGVRNIDGALSIHDGHLRSIDLGSLTSVRRVSLYRNKLTSIDLSPLAQDRFFGVFDIDLSDNQLTSVTFGSLLVDGRLKLNNNRLTSVDFGDLNANSSPDIFVHNNDFTALDCVGVGRCVCTDANVALSNCPEECQHCDDYREFPF